MSEKDERLQILSMIDEGTITPTEGARLLQALSGEIQDEKTASIPSEELVLDEPEITSLQTGQPTTQEDEVDDNPNVIGTPFKPADVDKWRRWWTIPLWIGVGVTFIGGILMYLAMQSAGTGSFWFACAWLPFLMGVAVIALAWTSRNARWIHIRIRQAPGERPQTIAISFPIPIRLTAWILRHFGHYIPNMEHTGLDEIILALGDQTSPQTPFYVEVDEGEDGEKVEVYIG
jgi:hypothetical protein